MTDCQHPYNWGCSSIASYFAKKPTAASSSTVNCEAEEQLATTSLSLTTDMATGQLEEDEIPDYEGDDEDELDAEVSNWFASCGRLADPAELRLEGNH